MAYFNRIISIKNEDKLINEFIKQFIKILDNKKKRFSFVLAGGKSPIKLYKKMSLNKEINWKKVDFFIGDERYVGVNSKDSNFRMCNKNLLSKIKINKNQIFRINTNNSSVKIDTLNYQKIIKKYFYKKKILFDLTLLGLGQDGHIASLFKKNINLKTKKVVSFINKKNIPRITITLPIINSSKNIFLWAPGKKKINIIKKIYFDNKKIYPASNLKPKEKLFLYSTVTDLAKFLGLSIS